MLAPRSSSDEERAHASPNLHQEATSIAGIAAGDHLCGIYETEDEHRAIVIPFIRLGIERGERAFYIVDANNAETILAYLAQAGFDPKPAMDRGQFVIATLTDTCLRNGVFDLDAMLDLLRSESDRAAADRYPALRVTGEMTWALREDKGAERLIEYEAKLNRFFPGSNVLAICQYDRRRFPARVLQDVIRTHPFVVYRGQVLENFYYVPVEDFLRGNQTEVEVERWLNNLQLEHLATATRIGLETEHRRIVDALRESEAMYRQLIESLNEGIWMIDEKAVTTFVNPHMFEMLGYTLEEMLGRHLLSFMDEQSVQLATLALARGQQGIKERHECEFLRKDGARIYASLKTSPITDRDGEYRGAVACVTDITARKELEAERESVIAQLRKALGEIKILRGFFPICAWCKKIRDDTGYWNQIESYISQNSDARFTHGVCPDCAKKLHPCF